MGEYKSFNELTKSGRYKRKKKNDSLNYEFDDFNSTSVSLSSTNKLTEPASLPYISNCSKTENFAQTHSECINDCK